MRRFTHLLTRVIVVGVVLTFGFLFSLSPAVADTGGGIHPQSETSLPPEVMQDADLMALWQKYSYLLSFYPLEEVQKMIAREESEKAKLLGIRIQMTGPGLQLQPAQMQPMGVRLCIRPFWGNGKVVWNFPNPGQNGAKYSVLPENGHALIWANPPEQEIDGIYRASWGSCTAFKVPDSATATFHNAEFFEVCYNAAACLAGACPKWVNTCAQDSEEFSWPDEPLR